MRIVTIGKRRFTVGFWWQVLDGQARLISRKERLKQAQQAAGEFSEAAYDAVVLRKQQYGLAKASTAGKSFRFPSLACALLERSPESWIGLFHLADDVWWVCAVGKRIIAGDGDAVFDSREAAQGHFSNLKAITTWESETIFDDTDGSLTHIQGLVRPSEKAEPLYPKSHKRLFLILTLAGISLGTGLYFWGQYEEEEVSRKRAQAVLEAQRKALAEKEAAVSDPARYFPHSWRGRPLPSAMGQAALRRILSKPVYAAGWRLDSVKCDLAPRDPGQHDQENSELRVVTTWLHAPHASFVSLPQGAMLNPSNSKQAVSTETAELDSSRPIRPVTSRKEATASLYQLVQEAGTRLSLSWANPESREIAEGLPSPVTVQCPWTTGTFSMTAIPEAAGRSMDFYFALDRIPGLVVESVTWNNNQFTVKGAVYATP